MDGGGINRAFESALTHGNTNTPSPNNPAYAILGAVDWQENCFALGVSLEHSGDSSHADRMISGLNTNGSNIPITWNIYNAPKSTPNLAGFRPIVFLEMTSTLMIYSGRVISVIN